MKTTVVVGQMLGFAVILGGFAVLSASTLLPKESAHGAGLMTAHAHQVPLENFVHRKSFSEVENAKALLEGLAAKALFELRSDSLPSTNRAATATRVLAELEQTIQEFRETEQETVLISEQLILLALAKRHDRWLDVYLHVLYQRPTHPLVGHQAARAVQFAGITGREDEVSRALQHVSAIPLEFGTKSLVQAALRQTDVARTKHVRSDLDELL